MPEQGASNFVLQNHLEGLLGCRFPGSTLESDLVGLEGCPRIHIFNKFLGDVKAPGSQMWYAASSFIEYPLSLTSKVDSVREPRAGYRC